MKTKISTPLSDLNLMIDISCQVIDEQISFSNFHRMIIRMAYIATDVKIDYARKRIYMNVLSEDDNYDLVVTKELAQFMSVNLGYTNLDEFLKTCILVNKDLLKHYYPFLISSFSHRKTRVLVLESA